MTTPNNTVDLYLPKTYVLERKGKAYATDAPMTVLGSGATDVPLPKGLSVVTVVATGLVTATLSVVLKYPSGSETGRELLTPLFLRDDPVRLWSGQISSPADGHLRLVVGARHVTTAGMNNGSVSVQILNFPPV